MRAELLVVVVLAAGCTREVPVPTVPANTTALSSPFVPPAERVASGQAKRGVGWTPNVAVDAQDRLHVAYTDADVGDVYYATSAPGASAFGPPELVDAQGAAGAYVRLALAPGGLPVISYVHQDERTLRVAHRPADVAAMKAAGAEVDDTPPLDHQAIKRAPGWLTEEIAFGEEVGTASALTVDNQGRPHVLYYARGDRVRYARRPSSVPAFGQAGVGYWERMDVDLDAGQSPQLLTALTVLDDGTVFAAYCNWQVVHGHLRLAVRHGAAPFTVVNAVEPPRAGIDGTSVSLMQASRVVTVVSTRLDDGTLLAADVNADAPAPLVERRVLARARGPAVVQKRKDGGYFALVRMPKDSETQVAGLYLIDIPASGPVQQTLLEGGTADDPWIDLALRASDAPVAVWFSEDIKGVKLYAP